MSHVLAIFAGVATIGAGLAVIEERVPLPVTESTVEERLKPIEERLASVEGFSKAQALESAELRLARLRQARDEFIQTGKPVPGWLRDEIVILERRVRQYRKALGLD